MKSLLWLNKLLLVQSGCVKAQTNQILVEITALICTDESPTDVVVAFTSPAVPGDGCRAFLSRLLATLMP